MTRLIFGLFLILSFTASGVVADDTGQGAVALSDTRPAILDVDYRDIENLGLYEREQDGSLGRNLWKNTDRSVAVALLRNVPAASKSPTMQRLLSGVLLSSADSTKLNNDIEPVAGQDLLSLRLYKLLKGGRYDQAYALYAKVEGEAYHESLARGGVLSMLYSGEKSTACLETNTLISRFSDVDFWVDLSAYCDASLSDEPDADDIETLKASKRGVLQSIAMQDDYNFSYTPESFAKLSMLERAVIAAEQKLNLDKIEQTLPSSIPASDIGIILGHEALSDDVRALVTKEAVAWGLKAPQNIPESVPENTSAQDIYDALTSMVRGQINISDDWINAIKDLDIAATDKNIYPRLRLAAHILQSHNIKNDSEFSALNELVQSSDTDTQQILYNIIENVDKRGKNTDNAAKAYEKHHVLTQGQTYVMPSDVVWDRLRNASQADAMAETVLLNIALFSNQALQNIYPALFRDAAQSLNNVDLKDYSEDMAVEAALGIN